jgi:hypothetical protein
MDKDTSELPAWRPNPRPCHAFLRYAETRIATAPLDEKCARAAIAWLRGMLPEEEQPK